MTTVVEKISNKHSIGHLIFMTDIDPKSYANAVLLRDYYQDHDIDFERSQDWRYYFIVRRHFLRKKKREHGGVWICHYCQKEITVIQKRNKRYNNPKAITVDHVVAIANGGDKLSTANMVECCSKCNQKKADKSYRAFVTKSN